MGLKSEISWKRRTEDGEKVEVYAQHAGSEWSFFVRGRRFDQWQRMPKPPLEDWLELLDAVERRIQRRLTRPEEGPRLRKHIQEIFPAADL